MPTMFEGRASTLRWLIAGPFSAAPNGRVIQVSGERFSSMMARLSPKASVTLPPALGLAGSFEVVFKRPRDFRQAEVARQLPALAELREVAEALVRARDPLSPAAALVRVQEIIGDGPLSRMLASADPQVPQKRPANETPVTAPPPTASANSGESAAIDAIFATAAVAPEAPSGDPHDAAKSGLDAFIGAMRGGKPPKRKPAEAPRARAAELINGAVDQALTTVMSTPALAQLERAWRGLRMIVAEAPGHDHLSIELVDADPSRFAEAIAPAISANNPMDRPDAVFLTEPVPDLATLEHLAKAGADSQVVVVAGIDPSVVGGTAQAPVGERVAEAWANFRGNPVSRWAAATLNHVVLVNEQGASDARIVFGAGPLAIATILSASVGQTGALSAAVGRAGAYAAPDAQEITVRGDRQTIPTQVFAPISTQRAVAERAGVVMLGSELGSNQVLLASVPVVLDADDAKQLPTQILVGRALRLTQFVRDRLPPGATPTEVGDAMEQASAAFLPNGPSHAVQFVGKSNSPGKLRVDVTFGAKMTGGPIDFGFEV